MQVKTKLLFIFILMMGQFCNADDSPVVSISRVPDDGILPTLLTDNQGGLHLIYYKTLTDDDDFAEGDIYYRYYNHENQQWSDAIQVSTKPFRQLGPLAKPAFAVDESGRVHVTWLQPDSYTFMYTRSNPQRNSFEQERSVVKISVENVEASASVSAHGDSVTLTWHAGDLMREEERAVYALTSTDNGDSFKAEVQLSDASLGACACCGLTSGYNIKGDLLVAYRSAINRSGRHMQLLTAGNWSGNTEPPIDINTHLVREWFLEACPVSTNYIADNYGQGRDGGQSWLVFESKGEIYQFNLVIDNIEPTLVRITDTKTRQKHPAIAINKSGDRLIVWGEAFGFSKGGSLKVQLFNTSNKPISSIDTGGINIPDHSVAAVAAMNDGSFLVMY